MPSALRFNSLRGARSASFGHVDEARRRRGGFTYHVPTTPLRVVAVEVFDRRSA